jgi:hypothetical protein
LSLAHHGFPSACTVCGLSCFFQVPSPVRDEEEFGDEASRHG